MSENYTRSFGEIVTGADASTVATVVRKPGWAHIARVTVAADSNIQPCLRFVKRGSTRMAQVRTRT